MRFTVDAALLPRARSEPAALDELIGQVWPEMYRVARGILRDRHAAEDAAQDACAAIARGLHALKDDRAFYSWMYRIAGRCAVAAARVEDVRVPVAAAVNDYDDYTIALDVRAAIAALPPVQRAAVVLHYYAGLSSGEVGEALRMPSATVRFHLMLARKALEKLLGGNEAADGRCKHA